MAPADLPAVAPLAIAYAVVTGRAWPSYLGPARPAPTAPALPSGPDTEAASSSLRSGSFRARASGKGVRYAHLDAAPFGPMPRPALRSGRVPSRTAPLLLAGPPTPRPSAPCFKPVRSRYAASGPTSSPAHSPVPPALRCAHRAPSHPGHEGPGCAVTPCAPLRERCSRLRRSRRFGPPAPGRAGGRPRARSPSSATLQKETCHVACSPEAGRFRSSTALRAVPDRPLPEQKRSLCVRSSQARHTLPRPSGAGLAVQWLLSPRGIVA